MSFTLLGILNSQAAGAVGAGAYDLLETTVLTSSASSVSFTGLDSYTDYKHLQIRWTGKLDVDNTFVTELQVKFNGNNGFGHFLKGNGSSVSSSSYSLGLMAADAIPGDGAGNNNVFGAGVADILDFSSSNKNTTLRGLGGAVTPADETAVSLSSSFWNNTAALTSLTILNSSYSLVAGSRFSLYGIKG